MARYRCRKLVDGDGGRVVADKRAAGNLSFGDAASLKNRTGDEVSERGWIAGRDRARTELFSTAAKQRSILFRRRCCSRGLEAAGRRSSSRRSRLRCFGGRTLESEETSVVAFRNPPLRLKKKFR